MMPPYSDPCRSGLQGYRATASSLGKVSARDLAVPLRNPTDEGVSENSESGDDGATTAPFGGWVRVNAIGAGRPEIKPERVIQLHGCKDGKCAACDELPARTQIREKLERIKAIVHEVPV